MRAALERATPLGRCWKCAASVAEWELGCFRCGPPAPMTSGQHAILDLLTHAAQSLQAAHELALDAGLAATAAVIQRGSVFVGSAVETLVQPLDVAGVYQPPIKRGSRDTDGAR